MNPPTTQSVDVQEVTDRELRSAAEAAAGSSEKIYLVRTPKGDLQYSSSPNVEGEVLLCIRRENTLSTHRTLASVTFTTTDGRPLKALPQTCDSLFWSRAAYEKFVLSYYRTLRVLNTDAMKKLEQAYIDDDTLAIAHDLKSQPTGMGLDEAVLRSFHVITKKEVIPLIDLH